MYYAYIGYTSEFPGKSQTRGGMSRVGIPAVLALRGVTTVSGKENLPSASYQHYDCGLVA